MADFKWNISLNDFITHLEISPIRSNNLRDPPVIYICVRGLRTGVAAPGPLSFFFNKLLTFAARFDIIYTEHLREIQYEN